MKIEIRFRDQRTVRRRAEMKSLNRERRGNVESTQVFNFLVLCDDVIIMALSAGPALLSISIHCIYMFLTLG